MMVMSSLFCVLQEQVSSLRSERDALSSKVVYQNATAQEQERLQAEQLLKYTESNALQVRK